MTENTVAGPAARLSRREMLGAGAAIPLGLVASAATAEPAGDPTPHPVRPIAEIGKQIHPGSIPAQEGLETLTAIEMEALEAFCARLVPTEAHGPGAKEARAAHYIDRALAGALMTQRAAYAAGLSALDGYARDTKGKPFAQLAPADQDAVLHDLEAGQATGFALGSAAFFKRVRTHTIEGMFCDPYYGGNANFVGWDLIGYPGLRMMVRPEDQRLVKPKALRQSAYSPNLFGRDSDG